ncbi:hypothetical protein ACLUEY_01390 [Vreelandella aquamarina]
MTWLNDAEVTLPKTPAELLEDAQAAKIAEINAAYAATAEPVIKDYPEVEQATWAIQNAEATAYIDWLSSGEGEQPNTPMLDAILAGRNGDDGTETLVDLCDAVLDNARQFTQFQVLTGKRQRLVKAAKTAETVEAVNAIAW